MTTAERAAAPLLALPLRRPDRPGQFAFADAEKIHRILRESGWRAVDIQSVDIACSLPVSGLQRYLARMGPLGQALQDTDQATRDRVVAAVHAAFETYVQGEEVRFTAACWQVDACAGPSV